MERFTNLHWDQEEDDKDEVALDREGHFMEINITKDRLGFATRQGEPPHEEKNIK